MSRRAALTAAVTVVAGCSLPKDTSGTLERARGGVLRVGVSHNPPYTVVREGRDPSGSEVDLVTEFAGVLGSRPEWHVAGEGELARRLHHGEIDVLVGGLMEESPLADEIAFTRSYATVTDTRGKEQKLVLAVRPGENALLVALEKFLAEKEQKR